MITSEREFFPKTTITSAGYLDNNAVLKQPTDPAPNPRRQLLLDAADAIDGDRNETYGGPESSFAVIADFWSTYLDEKIEPHQVAVMLALLKIARVKTTSGKHRDSWLDLAGYAGCGWEVAEQE